MQRRDLGKKSPDKGRYANSCLKSHNNSKSKIEAGERTSSQNGSTKIL